MSSISKIGLFALRAGKICVRTTPLKVSQRSCGWVQDYKPGPFPRTQEERQAAARKYNLIPEDYEPYEEGSGFGDYPKLPEVGQDARDPYDDFDYYYRRRNFGETVHIDFDTHMSDKHNPNQLHRYSFTVMVSLLTGALCFFVFCKAIDMCCDLYTHQPMKPKQFPKPGVIHYSFEPLD